MFQMLARTAFLAMAALLASSPAQTFPPGFSRDVLISPLGEVLGLSVARDGRIFLGNRDGGIRVLAGNTVALIGSLTNVGSLFSGGLQDVAVDPGWPARPYLYCYWTTDIPMSKRISRFTITGAVNDPNSASLQLGAEYSIIAGVQDTTSLHNGGTLRFGPDGMLYCSIGDDFDWYCNAQVMTDFLGKVIRFDVSGLPATGTGPPPLSQLVPPGNPFNGPTDTARLIFARGLRNPWRMTIDMGAGHLFIGDVGTEYFEEIDEASGGENFGWPDLEGPLPNGNGCGFSAPPFTAAAVSYDRSLFPPTSVVIAPLVVYRNQPNAAWNWGPEYEGNLLYTILEQGFWRRVRFDGSAWVPASPVPGQANSADWATGMLSMYDAEVGPDGAVYVIENWPHDALVRIRGTSPALSVISGDQQAGNAGTALLQPFVVGLVNGAGQPLAGINVSFDVIAGSGTLSAQTAITDAQGRASTTLTLGISPVVTEQVRARVPGAAAAVFHAQWRGLQAGWQPATRMLSLNVTHSQALAPLTVAADVPQSNPVQTVAGLIATSILAPGPYVIALDGLGLLGNPLSGMVTAPTAPPSWSAAFHIPTPLGGQALVFQAYALDSSLAPSLSAILISNPVLLTID